MVRVVEKKNTDRKVRHVKYFHGRLRISSKITDTRGCQLSLQKFTCTYQANGSINITGLSGAFAK